LADNTPGTWRVRTALLALGTAHLALIRFQQSEACSCFHRCPMPLDWSQGNLQEGLRRFHSGAFFEAHEHWESVWLTAQGPEKTFLQALIQVAASSTISTAAIAWEAFPCCGQRCAAWTRIPNRLLVSRSPRFARPFTCGSRHSNRHNLPPLLRFHGSNSQNRRQSAAHRALRYASRRHCRRQLGIAQTFQKRE